MPRRDKIPSAEHYLQRHGARAINLARKRYERGAMMAAVGKALGVSRCHAYHYVNAFGWKRRPGVRPPRYKEPWTWGDMTKLRKLMEAGKPLQVMVREMERTLWSVRKMMDEIPAEWPASQRRAWKPAEERQLQVLYKRGVKIEIIARTLNRTANSVRLRVFRLKCCCRGHRRWTPSQDRRLYRLYHAEHTWEQIGFKLDRTPKACTWRFTIINRRIRAGEFNIPEVTPMTIESMFDGPGPGDPAPEGAQTCRECGCWQLNACWDGDKGPCWWVEDDLCSHCEI